MRQSGVQKPQKIRKNDCPVSSPESGPSAVDVSDSNLVSTVGDFPTKKNIVPLLSAAVAIHERNSAQSPTAVRHLSKDGW